MKGNNYFKQLYGHSLALFVDLYHLTMAYGFWKRGMAGKEAAFNLFFRRRPFQGEFGIAAGLETAIDYIQNFHFDEGDLAYLNGLMLPNGKPLFEQAFLDYLGSLKITCDLDAMLEGTPLFPYQPLLRVQGPIIEAQLLEGPLLNIINFQSLIATKAARICWAARPDPVVEFGLRRAQGLDGALSGVRGAYIGGCESTSNVLAARLFGIPVKGTHAHSWIMAFDDEKDAFEAFADVMPKNCIFLVDTYNTLQGVKKAVSVAKAKGIDMLGVRLDSGDLAHLSIEARKLLDAEGFQNAKIMASNELDEHIIADLKHQGAKINLWGVGTNLITAKDQPALDGVYKLCAIRDKGGEWKYRMKLSEQMVKMTNPGILQIKRFEDEKGYVADMMYDALTTPSGGAEVIDLFEPAIVKKMQDSWKSEDLLKPILRQGKSVYEHPPLSQIRERTLQELERFQPGIRRFLYPQKYFYGLESSLYQKKLAMIGALRKIE